MHDQVVGSLLDCTPEQSGCHVPFLGRLYSICTDLTPDRSDAEAVTVSMLSRTFTPTMLTDGPVVSAPTTVVVAMGEVAWLSAWSAASAMTS